MKALFDAIHYLDLEELILAKTKLPIQLRFVILLKRFMVILHLVGVVNPAGKIVLILSKETSMKKKEPTLQGIQDGRSEDWNRALEVGKLADVDFKVIY